MSLLDVRDLSISFRTAAGPLHVVDRVSFSVERSSTLAIVGESGCGKSVTAQSLLGLLPPKKTMVSGSIRLDDRELTNLSFERWREVRGRKIAMVFQDPMTSLNPLLTVGAQLREVLALHQKLSSNALGDEAASWLSKVGLPDPVARLAAYPFELSGGMRQRVLIALALAGRPELLVADEPTTALDVTIQAQILDLLGSLQRELGMGMVFITHDLGVVERISDRIAVLYAGRVVESGPTEQVLSNPSHPYTRALLDSVPGFRPRNGRLASIGGNVPSPSAWPPGCRFHPRCPSAIEPCSRTSPESVVLGDRARACHNPMEPRA
ncbi:MAG TPA: ABC transporter ATP-binding protein [Fibrobacteria bacterium]|nr:ABC transporter ATP-binding protein [Fibrobacteria bacterium]